MGVGHGGTPNSWLVFVGENQENPSYKRMMTGVPLFMDIPIWKFIWKMESQPFFDGQSRHGFPLPQPQPGLQRDALQPRGAILCSGELQHDPGMGISPVKTMGFPGLD